ncbi:unnamed protein product [Rhizoctonia solani]|uniref:Lysine-specific metallo-endopeptidase domain-containing protein n=1 Tax=Rhizoctonia solani TaxID=456999 RepID=A0A8H3CME2_9AGAM|nr:unnamed protein product [Rhizoctonia solani]
MRAVFTAAVASAMLLRASAAPGLSVTVTPNPAPDANRLTATTTVTNTGSEPLTLLNDPRTVLSDLQTEMFTITSANGSPDFTGIRVKYSPEYAFNRNDPSSFTVLSPGQSREVVHDLGGVYDFTRTGTGEYVIEASGTFDYVDASGNLATLKAVTESSAFKLPGNLVPSGTSRARSRKLRSRQSGLNFKQCDDSQKRDVTQAVTSAETSITEVLSWFNTHSTATPRYKSWFGEYDSDRFDKVKEHFGKIQAFWNAPMTGTDSKAGTLIHEQTHFSVNGGTRDSAYETPPSDSDAQDVSHEPQQPEQHAESEKMNVPAKGSVFKFPKKKRVLTVLLVGETGSGKTSFMSLLLNLLEGNGPFELEEKHLADAESGLDRTQSQTTEPRLYQFTTTNGVKFQILDTPGLADTRGTGEDNKHRERIYRAVKERITTIDGIMIVANGRLERLTAATGYTWETLATLFPRSIKDNIGFLFTNVDAPDKLLLQKTSLPLELQTARHWCLDNPLSRHRNYLDRIHDLTESDKQRSRLVKRLEEDYEDTVESLDDWLEWLDKRESMPTTAIIELYQKSTEIESRLFGTTLSLENLSRLRKELQCMVSDLEAVEKKQRSWASIQEREPPKIWELVATSDYNTICLSTDCYSNCHPQCNLELSDPEDLGGWCRVFKTLGVPNRLIPFSSDSTVKCSHCEHEASEHRNYKRLYKERPSPIYEEAVRNLNDANESEENLRRAMGKIEREIEKVEQDIEESKGEIPALVDEMNNVSLSPNYAAYIRSAIRLFELRKKQLEVRPDSDGELSIIDKGIKAFKGHLDVLSGAATRYEQVVSMSRSAVAYGKRVLGGA